jgi:hypothetical protein
MFTICVLVTLPLLHGRRTPPEAIRCASLLQVQTRSEQIIVAPKVLAVHRNITFPPAVSSLHPVQERYHGALSGMSMLLTTNSYKSAYKVIGGGFLSICAAIIAILLFLYVRGPIGRLATLRLQECDLGVPFETGDVLVNPFRGILTIPDIKVSNPQGYDGDHLLKIEQALVDVHLVDLFLRRRLTFEHIDVKDVHVVFETKLGVYSFRELGHTNVFDVEERMCRTHGWDTPRESDPLATKALTEMTFDELLWEYIGIDCSKVTFQEITIEGISAEARIAHLATLGRVQCDDVHCDNFEVEVGKMPGIPAIIHWVLRSVLKSAGNRMHHTMHTGLALAEAAEKEVAKDIRIIARRVVDCCSGVCPGHSGSMPSHRSVEQGAGRSTSAIPKRCSTT